MFQNHRLIKPALFAILFALSPAAHAEDNAALFDSHDKNKDGVLTIEDAVYLERAIFMLDKDQSGDVTQAEFQPLSEYGAATIEDPYFFVPSAGDQISSEPYDGPPPKVLNYTILTIDLTAAGKVRYATRKGAMGEDSIENITIEFAPPPEADITFG